MDPYFDLLNRHHKYRAGEPDVDGVFYLNFCQTVVKGSFSFDFNNDNN